MKKSSVQHYSWLVILFLAVAAGSMEKETTETHSLSILVYITGVTAGSPPIQPGRRGN